MIEVTTAAIAALPIEVVTAFRQAVETLDINEVQRLIPQIRQQNAPLAEALAELARHYRFDVIQQIFEDMP